jgi:hypothetical protein
MKIITAIPVLLVIAVVGIAFAGDQQVLKDSMKVNNEKMGEMLENILLDESWGETAKDAAILEQHAEVIKALDPSEYTKGMPKAEYFHGYALHLQSSSHNLKVAAEEIEKEVASGADRSAHLRPNAAVFFGQAVSMCTNCHNQFRGK